MLSIVNGDSVLNESCEVIKIPEEGMVGFLKGEKCTFFIQFGWVTPDELFRLRQIEPRIAP